MLEQSKILALFPIPVYVSKLNSLTHELKQLIVDQEYELMHSKKGFYTVNQSLLNLTELKNVREEVDAHVENYAKNILKVDEKQKFYMTNSWAVKHRTGNHADTHLHTNSLISGVFYLYQNSEYGNLQIQKHYYNLFPTTVSPDFSEYNMLNSTTWTIESQENSLILFPSTTLHSVSSNNSQYTRYSVAFNYFIKGNFGNKESYLEIK